MALVKVPKNTRVKFKITFKNDLGVVDDPSVVRFRLYRRGVQIAFHDNAFPPLVNEAGVGAYSYSHKLTLVGDYDWEWEAAGTFEVSVEGTVTVMAGNVL